MVPPTPSAAYDPRASSPPLILTSLRLWSLAHFKASKRLRVLLSTTAIVNEVYLD